MFHLFKSGALPQVFAAFTAALITFQMGTQIGLSSSLIPQLQKENGTLHIEFEDGSWIVLDTTDGSICNDLAQYFSASLISFIGIPSLVFGGIMAGYLGRKKFVLLMCIPHAISWVMLATASSYTVILISRILAGFAVYSMFPSSGIFIAEICEARLRGFLGGLPALFLSSGVFTSFFMGYLCKWRTQAWISVFAPILLFSLMLCVKETPYWLVEQGKKEEAKKSLQWYRGMSNSDKELEEIIKNKEKREHQQATKLQFFKAIFSPEAVKGYKVPGVLQALNQLSGICVLSAFMTNIATDSGSSINPSLFPVIVGGVRILFGLLSTLLLKNGNKKIIFTVCAIMTTLSTSTIALFCFLKDDYDDLSEKYGWIPLVAVLMIFICFSFGVQPIMTILSAEMYPAQYRTACFGFIATLFSLCTALNVQIYPLMKKEIGIGAAFSVYAAVSFIQTIYGFFMIPDNRGLSLVKIENQVEEQQ